ncbi:IQ and ubiquitin-like domain-containing protein isoform X2 [Orussus abietinus]|uniref:IQ and ubiquitin-like domain-containing protein isoform X2 n=1 Tax=Orussus abietinus TaxID=222816 RepID=UPI000625E159|nr:IQ and ubiquitin-like domain-containing protein isoform X2 [Orussus abietinus]
MQHLKQALLQKKYHGARCAVKKVRPSKRRSKAFNLFATEAHKCGDCYIPNASDKYMTATPYETYEQMQLRLNTEGHVRTIQRYYRAYRVLKYIRESAALYRQLKENCRMYEKNRVLALEWRREEDRLRKICPRSRADFHALFNMVESWELARGKSTLSQRFQASRLSENYMTLAESIKMINAIEEHRQLIKREFEAKKRVQFLTLNCQPIRWNGYKGKPVEMVTLKVQKARELKSLYDGLCKRGTSVEERIELLVLLKTFLGRLDCRASNELGYLLDQEISLISVGIKSSHLEQLRERVAQAYLNFAKGGHTRVRANREEEEFNDSQCDQLGPPRNTKFLLCRSCAKLIPYHRFSVYSGTRRIARCMSCTWLRRGKVPRINYGPYLILLNDIRAEERKRNSFSCVAFVMRGPDIYHLVNNIWHGHSIVSEKDDIFRLKLIRFRQDEEWSPWNCILLTDEEAEVHKRVQDFPTVYSVRLLHKISLAHQVAKNHFKNLIRMEMIFRESGRYYMIQDREDYVPRGTLEGC